MVYRAPKIKEVKVTHAIDNEIQHKIMTVQTMQQVIGVPSSPFMRVAPNPN